jgi:ribosomal-protein-alanine N-acetyltransferase
MEARMRWMIRRDMGEVLAIEADAFGAFAWTEDDFVTFLRQRTALGKVAELDDRVAGFVCYKMEKSAIEIHNLAVSQEFRHCGIGRALIANLIERLSPNRRALIAAVREINLPAQLFFRACGFRACAIRREYFDNGETAYIFRLTRQRAAQLMLMEPDHENARCN